MVLTKATIKEELKKRLQEKYTLKIEEATNQEIFQALGQVIKAAYAKNWQQTRQKCIGEKQVYYFSIEFLPGKLLKSNLLNLGILDVTRDALHELSIDLDELIDSEKDMALGNGGLGRLASCFMDSLASSGLPGNGNGIRYDYGLFKQRFVDGYQVELPDEWLRDGNIWEVRRESKACDVRFGGMVYLQENSEGRLKPVYEHQQILRAVPYDTGMVGYKNDMVTTMRLWSIEIPDEEEGQYQSIQDRRAMEDITAVLYPDDSNEKGRLVRLAQEYFFVSAGLQSILRYAKKTQIPSTKLNEHIAVHINDTHPALCVPEMMRLLIDEEELSWEQAWDITVKVMSYTNHTIMAEALEKWPVDMLSKLLPRVYQIIEEIDRRYVEQVRKIKDYSIVESTRIIQNGQVHMAHLAIIGSHSTNGVAKLHSDLLKSVVLKDFYAVYPERFNNKTNGIAQRRWLQLANEPLAKLLDKTIGTTWRENSDDLKLLMNYRDDETVLTQLAEVKRLNKQKLAQYIKQTMQIDVSPDAIFDVQIKRLHAYKRQLMNLMHIIKCYQEIKANPQLEYTPRVFIFGAKAAPSYHYAKSIIKCINETANLVNNDPDIHNRLKIVFLENYNVSLAERIIPAADISEQISLASKEASGTSNMKLMLNGAVTLATLDGANVEIRDAVGNDNIKIFGLTEQEVYAYYENQNYSSIKVYEETPLVRQVLAAFVDGTIPNIQYEGREIVDSLLKYNDEYFVLRDFIAYVSEQEQIEREFQDKLQWSKISLSNIANAGRFSSDETVKRYAEDIWQIKPVTVQ
ncbi:MAG: glycogen/starch/alpha-glucan phosphorylase [Enterococcus sp.]